MKIIKYNSKIKPAKRKKEHKKRKLHIDKKLVYLTLVFVFGLLFGALFIRFIPNECKMIIKLSVDKIVAYNTSKSFIAVLLFALKINFIYFILLYFVGTSMLGREIIWIFPFVQGIVLGMFSSFLYREYGLHGLLFYCTFFLLPTVFMVSSSLLCCKESILTATDLQNVLLNTQSYVKHDMILKLYTLRYLIFALGAIFASFLYALLVILFQEKVTLDFLH